MTELRDQSTDADRHIRAARPCPFAAVEDQDQHALQIVADMISDICQVRCDCGASSPRAPRPSEAVERWNTRYADLQLAEIERRAGRGLIMAERRTAEAEDKFAAMQVENNRLLERARTAEASLELTTKLAEKAAEQHG